MRTTSGLVLDIYDDFRGETLRAIWPTQADVPALVKQAHILSAEEQQRLPDDVFALVLVNGTETLRKFACIDSGNTALHVAYLLKHAHKLPLEAQKTAAANLQIACGWYDLPVPPELEKIALGLGAAMTAMTAVPIVKGTSQSIRDNMAATRALEGAGAGVVTPEMRSSVLKHAEVSGTSLAPEQVPGSLAPTKSKATVLKVATLGHLVAHAGQDTPPDLVHPPTEEAAPKLPQSKHLRPTVDVTNHTPPARVTQNTAEHFALPSRQKYPLDSYAQVKEAGVYFDTYYKHMLPADRREYAMHYVPRASELLLPVSDVAYKYASMDFAPDAELKVAFDLRRQELAGRAQDLEVLGQIELMARAGFYKEARLGGALQPATPAGVADLLAEFDKVAGLDALYDRSIHDPYYSVFGFEKRAEDGTAAWSDIIGNEMVTEADLDRLARANAFGVKETFGSKFQERFLENPVATYKGAPRAQKKMLIRMAHAAAPGELRAS